LHGTLTQRAPRSASLRLRAQPDLAFAEHFVAHAAGYDLVVIACAPWLALCKKRHYLRLRARRSLDAFALRRCSAQEAHYSMAAPLDAAAVAARVHARGPADAVTTHRCAVATLRLLRRAFCAR
jgi:hypothetical protein